MPGLELSSEALRRIDILFAPESRDRAKELLFSECGNNLPFAGKSGSQEMDRIRFAALKYSDGDLAKLERAVKLAKRDWRDLLMAAGFANNSEAHRTWKPKPYDEPPEIDPAQLAAGIQERLAALLRPLGFERQDDAWRRGGEVPQSVRLIQGLTNRTETRFFLRLTLNVEPAPIILNLPRLGRGAEAFSQEQGYILRSGGRPEDLCASVMTDADQYVPTWLERFTTAAEVQRGFEDKTLAPRLPVDGGTIIF